MIAWPSWLKPTLTAAPSVKITPGVVKLPPGGSWQNPAWSPTGELLSVTRFARYNEGAEKVASVRLSDGYLTWVADGVSQPGACWHRTMGIIFSRDSDIDAEGDAIYVAAGPVRKLLGLRGLSLIEPSWSPDGTQFAVEVHMKDSEKLGRIALVTVATGALEYITKLGLDCRQPNWDPRTNRIAYQRANTRRGWDVMIQSPQIETSAEKICSGTDATWMTGGVLYSGEDGLYCASLARAMSIPVGPRGAYKGAPSVSPDGRWVACEASDREPDNGPGTRIEIWPVS